MALLFIDGFDHYASADITKKWTWRYGNDAYCDIQAAGRTGANAMAGLAHYYELGVAYVTLPVTGNTGIVGFALKMTQHSTRINDSCILGFTQFGSLYHASLGVAPNGTLLEHGCLLVVAAFEVRCAVLDHPTPCLAFAVQEAAHVNVWRNRLSDLGVEPGPWLREAKHAILAGAADETVVTARGLPGEPQRPIMLGTLRNRALQVVPGQKFAYVTDAAHHAGNVQRIVELAAKADLLFIECTFLDADARDATRKCHLTARQAGAIAAAAGVSVLVPFHFSPRYAGREAELRAEAQAAFGGPVT